VPPPYGRSYYVPPEHGLPPPVAVELVPDSPFGVAIVPVPPTTSGPAGAGLAAGIASILVSLVVACFGLVGASGGWGPVVAGAFAVLAGCAGVAGVWLGLVGLRQVRRGAGSVAGRGMALSGVICAAVGLAIAALAVALSVATATVS
jgi:hypothetical protein